jgi:hypothetical protein
MIMNLDDHASGQVVDAYGTGNRTPGMCGMEARFQTTCTVIGPELQTHTELDNVAEKAAETAFRKRDES